MRTSLPKSVYDMVVAVVSDYGRMKKAIEKNTITREQAVIFTRYITAVDDALIAVCAGEDPAVYALLRSDIAERNGFERSKSMRYYTTQYLYEKRKGDTIVLIARMLNFV